MWQWLLALIFPQRAKEEVVETLAIEDFSSLPRPHEQLENIISLYAYKDSRVNALIWELKYHRSAKALSFAGQLLAQHIIDEYADKKMFDNWTSAILVAVPSSTGRLRERGYSQTDLLAQAIIKFLPKEIVYKKKALEKICETGKQSWSNTRKQRLANLHGSFRADPRIVADQHIILIDDVTTTGATIAEAIRALTAAGAREVITFTIAH